MLQTAISFASHHASLSRVKKTQRPEKDPQRGYYCPSRSYGIIGAFEGHPQANVNRVVFVVASFRGVPSDSLADIYHGERFECVRSRQQTENFRSFEAGNGKPERRFTLLKKVIQHRKHEQVGSLQTRTDKR